MRRVGAGGMAAALIVGLGVAAAIAGETDGDAKPAKGWWSGWFADKPKPKGKAERKSSSEDVPAPRPEEPAASVQQRQMNAVLRRMEVCDRLRTIALQSGNEELMRQADVLEGRARAIYERTTSHPPAPRAVEEDVKPVQKKTASKRKNDKPLDEPILSKKRLSPGDRKALMDAEFGMRERDILNGVETGRNRP